MDDRDTARAAKEHLRAELARLGGVNGVGIGRRGGGYVVTVNVVEQELCARVPVSVDGVPVEVRVVGRVRATTAHGARMSGSDPDPSASAGGPSH